MTTLETDGKCKLVRKVTGEAVGAQLVAVCFLRDYRKEKNWFLFKQFIQT